MTHGVIMLTKKIAILISFTSVLIHSFAWAENTTLIDELNNKFGFTYTLKGEWQETTHTYHLQFAGFQKGYNNYPENVKNQNFSAETSAGNLKDAFLALTQELNRQELHLTNSFALYMMSTFENAVRTQGEFLIENKCATSTDEFYHHNISMRIGAGEGANTLTVPKSFTGRDDLKIDFQTMLNYLFRHEHPPVYLRTSSILDSHLERAATQSRLDSESWKAPVVTNEFELSMASAMGITFSPNEKQTVLEKYSAGHFSTIGWRNSNEDAHYIHTFVNEENPLREKGIDQVAILGIFDGHGGKFISEKAASIVGPILMQSLARLSAEQLKESEQVRIALENAFYIEIDEALHQFCEGQPNEVLKKSCLSSGSTAVVAVIFNHAVYTVNLGDSRALLVRKSVINRDQRLSQDHRIYSPSYDFSSLLDIEEIDGVYKRGGNIKGTRLDGMLTVPRALGDWNISGIGRKPDVTRVDLSEAKALVLFCDGILETLNSDPMIAGIVSQLLDQENGPEQVAAKLAQIAFNYGSQDNISTIVLDLRSPSSKK